MGHAAPAPLRSASPASTGFAGSAGSFLPFLLMILTLVIIYNFIRMSDCLVRVIIKYYVFNQEFSREHLNSQRLVSFYGKYAYNSWIGNNVCRSAIKC
jgi:hypothetical protein